MLPDPAAFPVTNPLGTALCGAKLSRSFAIHVALFRGSSIERPRRKWNGVLQCNQVLPGPP
jgi:hypothetical protein